MQVKILMEHYDNPEYRGIDGYKKLGGYEVLPNCLKMNPRKSLIRSKQRVYAVVVVRVFQLV